MVIDWLVALHRQVALHLTPAKSREESCAGIRQGEPAALVALALFVAVWPVLLAGASFGHAPHAGRICNQLQRSMLFLCRPWPTTTAGSEASIL